MGPAQGSLNHPEVHSLRRKAPSTISRVTVSWTKAPLDSNDRWTNRLTVPEAASVPSRGTNGAPAELPKASPPNKLLRKEAPMPTPSPEAQELANQIDAIRADLQNLTATVGRIANKQVNRAQEKAVDVANEAEEAIKRNPLSAIAIAVGLGFLFGVFTRR
jgi:ElaB/YqjD/DUF883 family membrane-anchored ribosome-binding protein